MLDGLNDDKRAQVHPYDVDPESLDHHMSYPDGPEQVSVSLGVSMHAYALIIFLRRISRFGLNVYGIMMYESDCAR
jgi:hypothetical protein